MTFALPPFVLSRILSFLRAVFLLPKRQKKIIFGGKFQMKKVVFSIQNVRSKSDKKLSGFGYLAEGSLLCPCISKNNKPYIRVFDDVVNRCKPMQDRPNEFQGYVTMYFTDVPVYREKDGAYDMLDLEVEYKIWYKLAEDK